MALTTGSTLLTDFEPYNVTCSVLQMKTCGSTAFLKRRFGLGYNLHLAFSSPSPSVSDADC
eukprot:950360-Pyramimonas_sp.AAC.1